MHLVQLVAILSVLQFIFFGKLTGDARAKSGLKAPAMTGDEGFERMHRVHMNTLETLVAFLPSLFLAAAYWSSLLVAALGAVYLVGRFVYWRAYVANPSRRFVGFMLSVAPTILLAVMALDMSLLESGRLTLTLEAVNLRDLLREVEALMRPQAQAKSLALHIDADPGVPEAVRADRTRVKQILFNLVNNAVKFSDRGVVVVDLRRALDGEGREWLEFLVTDTGIGMDQGTMERLFRRFSQGDESRSRRHGGTGLGLAICRSIIEAHGGRLVLVGVLSDGETTEMARNTLASWGVKAHFLVDRGGVSQSQAGVRDLPSTIVIDAQGKLRWVAPKGASDADVVSALP